MKKKKVKKKSGSSNSEGSLTEIQLIKLAILASTISLFADLFFIESNRKALYIENERLRGIEPPVVPPTVSQIVVSAAMLGLASNSIVAPIAFIRLRQRQQAIAEGTDRLPITPSVYISIGALLALIASIFLTTGAIQREQQTRITII